MAFNVFELFAKLGIDTSEYDKGLQKAETKGSSFGSGLLKAAGVAGVAITAATTAVVKFGKDSVDAGMDFDKAMSQVAATMGKSVGEIENLRDFAQEMGRTTAFSATQAAEALNYMALAGYDAETSMQMLPTVLNLAASGGMELATASDMVTDAQTALGLSLEQTSAMVDQMAKTASTTNTSVSQLGEAFLTIGGTAQYMSGGTQELSQVLGILADNGIKGSEAGTHLRNMLLKLSSPTNEGAKAIKDLGLQVFDASGNMRSFQDIFADLNTKMADFTDEQKIQTFSKLFNARDVAAANALLTTNKDRWDEVGVAIENASGSAGQMAETQLDNLAGDITLFKSALEGAQIAISDSVTPELRQFIQFGTEGLSRLTGAFQEGGLEGFFKEFGSILSDAVKMIVQELPTVIRAGGELLKALVQGLIENAPVILDAAVEVVTTLADFLSENAEDIAPAIVTLAHTIVSTLTKPEVLGPLQLAGADIIVGLIKGLAEATPELTAMIPEIISNLILVTQQNAPAMTVAALQILEALGVAVVGAIGGLMGMSYDEVVESILALDEYLRDFGSNLVSGIEEIGGNIIGGLVDFFEEGIEGWTGFFDDILDGVAGWGEGLLNSFTSQFGKALNLVTGFVDDILDAFDFDWSLPQIKLPHFKVSGGEAPWGFAGQGSFPSIKVQWYKKAMNAPMLLDSATIFGYAHGQALGGGEAGDEMIYGKDALMRDIAAVVDAKLSKLQFVVPVYIGTRKIDEQIVTASARSNVISGGR